MNKSRPALFLDRDGVVNKNHSYVFEIQKFEFFPEIFEVCLIANQAKMPIVIVTNQSGIGRGYFSQSEYENLTNWMLSEFINQGIQITEVLHAPENPDSTPHAIPERRKPSPTMFLEAATKLNLDLSKSIMIGDNESDMLGAERAGIAHRLLIGHLEGSTVATVVIKDHRDCVKTTGEIVVGIRKNLGELK